MDEAAAISRENLALDPWEVASQNVWGVHQQRSRLEQMRCMPWGMMLLSMESSMRGPLHRHQVRIDAMRLAIAATLYRRAEGDWPDEWAALVPTYLDEVPRDVVDGQALRMVIREDQFTIYSVGRDGDDDGGVSPVGLQNVTYVPPAAADVVESREPDVADGDWVLFPIPRLDEAE